MDEIKAILLSKNMYNDGYNQAIDDVLNVVEWDGYTLDIKERIEQLKK